MKNEIISVSENVMVEKIINDGFGIDKEISGSFSVYLII